MAAVNLVALASLLLLAAGSGSSIAVAVRGSRSDSTKFGTDSLTSQPASEFPSDFVAVSRNNGAADREVADNEGSATKRKITRQINFDGSGVSDEKYSQRDFTPFHSETKTDKDKLKAEEFDGFPEGFVTGLKPFNFEETAGSHRDATSTGFFQFPDKDNLPSFATTLGGLKRLPPISSATRLSSSTSAPDSDGGRAASSDEKTRSRDAFSPDVDGSSRFSSGSGFGGHREITPDSFREENANNNDPDLPARRELPDSKRGGRGGSRHSFDDDYGQYFPHRGASSTEEEEQRRASSPAAGGDGGGESRPGSGEGFGEESRNAGNRPSSSAESAPVFSGFTDYEGPSSFRSAFPSSSGPDSSSTSRFPSRETINGLTGGGEDYEHQSSSSNSVKVTAPSPKTSSSFLTADAPLSTFRDTDKVEKADSQNFVPVGHFQNGRFSRFPDFSSGGDGGFQPLLNRPAAHDEPTGHAVRNFRQTSRPHFFITNEGGGGGANFDGFFGGGGGDDFGRAPQQHQGGSSSERFVPHQPQFHFEQRDHRRPPVQQLHGDDVTNHHSSATNLLGSGNFNIIRGGIFADDENPSASDFHSFRPPGGHHHHHAEPPKDFFHGFRDFQPFGGSLNNALSLNSQNIQKAPSEKHTVTATTTTSTTTATPPTTRRSRKKSATSSL